MTGSYVNATATVVGAPLNATVTALTEAGAPLPFDAGITFVVQFAPPVGAPQNVTATATATPGQWQAGTVPAVNGTWTVTAFAQQAGRPERQLSPTTVLVAVNYGTRMLPLFRSVDAKSLTES